eukprot:gene16456-22442_t
MGNTASMLEGLALSEARNCRPDWLSHQGPGQGNVDPTQWALTIDQWLQFVDSCKNTPIWQNLVDKKDGNERQINMYELVAYFVGPWTRGIGNSIGLLMNPSSPVKAEIMISHSWGGSVMDTYDTFEFNTTVAGNAPKSTAIFFCAFSLYQPEDGEGLSIEQQLSQNPFSKIITSNPAYGMWVIHTNNDELYTRLWCVFEISEAIAAKCRILGVSPDNNPPSKTDMSSFTTARAKCGSEQDTAMITNIIAERGGFGELDLVIFQFRRAMAYGQFFNSFDLFAGMGFVNSSMGMFGMQMMPMVTVNGRMPIGVGMDGLR